MWIYSIYQDNYTTEPEYFNYSKGEHDATEAFSLVTNLGQPANTPIYFAIECDPYDNEIDTYIIPYLQGVMSKLSTSNYKLGVYGSRLTCGRIAQIIPVHSHLLLTATDRGIMIAGI